MAPRTSRVAFLFNPANAAKSIWLQEVLAAAPAVGVNILPVALRNPKEHSAVLCRRSVSECRCPARRWRPCHVQRSTADRGDCRREEAPSYLRGKAFRRSWWPNVIRAQLFPISFGRLRLTWTRFSRALTPPSFRWSSRPGSSLSDHVKTARGARPRRPSFAHRSCRSNRIEIGRANAWLLQSLTAGSVQVSRTPA